jgi:hypothetical protein
MVWRGQVRLVKKLAWLAEYKMLLLLIPGDWLPIG